jgi:hypothetical protein
MSRIDDDPVREPGQNALQRLRSLVAIQMLDRLIEKNNRAVAEKRAGTTAEAQPKPVPKEKS